MAVGRTGEYSGQQVLRGGLAGGARDADHGERGALGGAAGADPPDGFSCQCAHGQDSVLDDDGGYFVPTSSATSRSTSVRTAPWSKAAPTKS